MSASLLSPLYNIDMDTQLAKAGAAVVDTATLTADLAHYMLNMLTQENLDAGMLLKVQTPLPNQPAGPPVPLTQAELDQYRLYFSQMEDISMRLLGGAPSAVDLVQPWLGKYRGAEGWRV